MKDFWKGFYLACGVACAVGCMQFFDGLVTWASNSIHDGLGAKPIDNGDVSWAKRSGMNVHTDALTGCQYLETRSAITPRMGADGRQICGVRP